MQFVPIKEWEIVSFVDVHSNAICHKKVLFQTESESTHEMKDESGVWIFTHLEDI